MNASGAAWQGGAMDATGALMILFLKLVAIAECRQAGERNKAYDQAEEKNNV